MLYIRHSVFVLLLLSLAFLFNVFSAQAATIVVTTAVDEDLDNADCSLREAIIAANSDNAYNGCSAGSGADIIDLSNFTSYTLSGVLPNVSSDITIAGGGATITASTTGYRALTITAAGLTLGEVTVRGFNNSGNGGAIGMVAGSVTLNSGAILENNTASRGGGIYGETSGETISIAVNSGALVRRNTVNAMFSGAGGGIYCLARSNGNCTITVDGGQVIGNRVTIANDGGGIYISSITGATASLTVENSAVIAENTTLGNGGGIFAASTTTTVTIDSATIRDNVSTGSGGGIMSIFGASITVENESVIRNNRATGSSSRGGGIQTGGTLTVNKSTISDNHSNGGGGIHVGGNSNATIENESRILRNTAGTPSSSGGGGGIQYQSSGTLIVDNSQVNDNTDGAAGGGIASFGGTVIIRNNSQVNGNTVTGGTGGGGVYNGTTSPSLTITDSQVSGNTATGVDGGGIYHLGGVLTITGSRLQFNDARDGDAIYSTRIASDDSITNSCIVGNRATVSPLRYAVRRINAPALSATDNWWGSAWGPLIIDLDPAQTNITIGSSVSNGDSLSGDGANLVDVGLLSDGDWDTAPTGNWKTSAPTGCASCTGVSSVGGARVCS
jgi:CSLREA domain-containing protein